MRPPWRSAATSAALTGVLVLGGVVAAEPGASGLHGASGAATAGELDVRGTSGADRPLAALGQLVGGLAVHARRVLADRAAGHPATTVLARDRPRRDPADRRAGPQGRERTDPGRGAGGGGGPAPRSARATVPARTLEPLTFTLASFNVLGSQHTTPTGTKPRYAAGTRRAAWARAMIDERGYDVVGLQESQPDQLAVLLAGGAWHSFPSLGTAGQPALAQALVWRAADWSMVSAHTFVVPFLGRPRPQPAVLLRHRATGRRVWFVNVHLTPRRDRRDGERERDAGTAALAAQVRALRATGVPVAVTGDMNEHAEIFCDLTTATGVVAASGGSAGGRCLPPRVMRVDWIFGTPELRWSSFRFAADPAVRRVTDHAVPVVEVTLPGN